MINQIASPDCPVTPEAVTLRQGLQVIVRAIRQDDAPRLQALHARLSLETILFRFLRYARELSAKEAEYLAHVDYATTMAFVATITQGSEERIIAVARYAAVPSSEPGLAEAAVVVEDSYQRQGLGTILSDRLALCAREHGIRTFVAVVHSENTQVIRLMRHCGLTFKVAKRENEAMEIRIDLTSGSVDKTPEVGSPTWTK